MCIKTIAVAIILTMQLNCIERRKVQPSAELVVFIAPKIKTEKIETNVRELFDVEVELAGKDDLNIFSDHWLTIRDADSAQKNLRSWDKHSGTSSATKIKITALPTVIKFKDLFYTDELQASIVAEISTPAKDGHVTFPQTDSVPVSIAAKAGGIKTEFKVNDKKDSITMQVTGAKPNTTYDVTVALSLDKVNKQVTTDQAGQVQPFLKKVNKSENKQVTTNQNGQGQLVLAEKINPDNTCAVYLKSKLSTNNHGEVPIGGNIYLPCLKGEGGEVTVNAQGNVMFALSSTESEKLKASNSEVYIEFSYLEYEKYGDESNCGGFRTYQIADNLDIGAIASYNSGTCYYVKVNVFDNSATASACANLDGGNYRPGTSLLNDILEPPKLTITRKVGNC